MSKQMRIPGWVLAGALAAAGPSPADAAEYRVSSPDGRIIATLTLAEGPGTLTYSVQSGGAEVIASSSIGISTSRGDFTSGMTAAGTETAAIDETYRLPAGKRSLYVNRANELILRLARAGQEVRVRFRAYDDGVAFSFAIPGSGSIEITGETSAIALSGGNQTYWGQNHPNNYGYESKLGPITGTRMSMPVLARLGDRNHFVFMAQAASYGAYIIPNFQRSESTFRFAFPMDQQIPVQTSLPFQSPWRLAVISPQNLSKIVETIMLENLNPPTEPSLANADWVKPGRAVWDFMAGDRSNYRGWMDAAAALGWEYYLADAGFAGRFNVRDAVAYGAAKGVGLIGWDHTRNYTTREKVEARLRAHAESGLKGAKIDFFDRQLETDAFTNDQEDTQRLLQLREWMMEYGAQHKLLLEFHGSTLPSGERRRYPNFMNSEGVHGMEGAPTILSDLTIPFVRNIMGSVSYTIIRFAKSPGSRAYQLASAIVYEAGIQIYAELHSTLLAWDGAEMIRKVPSAWDDTRFIDGLPGSHAVLARRKGHDWFVGGMTDAPRNAQVPLSFLAPGTSYQALIFRDGAGSTAMTRETRTVTRESVLEIPMLDNGGFAVHLHPPIPPAGNAPYARPVNYSQGAGKAYRIVLKDGSLQGAWTRAQPRGWNGNASLSVTDLSGRRVGEIPFLPRSGSDRNGFSGPPGAAGIYLLSVQPLRD